MSYFPRLNTVLKGLSTLEALLQSLLLFAIRLYFGYAFFEAGMGKFNDFPRVASFFQEIGIPFALWNAYLVASVEVTGGLLLILGLGTRFASAVLVFLLVVAYLTAHFDAVKHLLDNPAEFAQQGAFSFLLATLLLLAFGPGKIAIDYCIVKWICHAD